MITGFEKETELLTEFEKQLVNPICAGLRAHVGKHRAISNKLICEAINERPKGFITEDMVKAGFKLTDIRLRKIINHIRNNDIIPMLCSNAKGYYVGSKNEAREYLQSLDERIGAIQNTRNSISKQLNNAA